MQKQAGTLSRKSALFFAALLLLLAQATLSTTPTDTDLANQFFYNGEYDKAIEYYLKALESAINKSVEVKYRIGLSHYMLGNLQEAVKFWTEAKKQSPNLFKGRIFRIPSDQMAPQLILGDLIIVDTDYYKYKSILRGDVIIYRYPYKKDTIYIKRIIGLPEEVVEVKDTQVFINDSGLQDRYASSIDSEYNNVKNWGPTKVPRDSYFVLGDNRNKSVDSRHYGFIHKDLILGKALVIYGSTPEADSLNIARPERTGKIIE